MPEETEERPQLIPSKKMQALLSLLSPEEKMDKDVHQLLSQFSEKFINDLINRASLLAKHKGRSTVMEDDVRFVLETEFDYLFGSPVSFGPPASEARK